MYTLLTSLQAAIKFKFKETETKIIRHSTFVVVTTVPYNTIVLLYNNIVCCQNIFYAYKFIFKFNVTYSDLCFTQVMDNKMYAINIFLPYLTSYMYMMSI